jgi:hypothetical protein
MPLNSSRTHWYLPESDLWNQIGTLNNELISLKDVILLGETDSTITFSNYGSAVCRGVELPDGTRYVIVVNPTPNTIRYIRIRGLASNESLESQFSSPAATKLFGSWWVTLPAYGVGVYLVDL